MSARMAAFRRWAAILLPLVIGARAILLIFQLHGEHDARAHRDDPPAWPPAPGEELHFRTGDARAAAWGTAENHPQLLVPETQKDYLPTPQADAGCVLDLAALMRHGGTLTMKDTLPPDGWRAEWSGGRTVPELRELPDAQQVDRNALDAADCGGSARLELTGYQAHVLVAFLSGEAFPSAPDPAPRIRPVHIYVAAPSPAGTP